MAVDLRTGGTLTLDNCASGALRTLRPALNASSGPESWLTKPGTCAERGKTSSYAVAGDDPNAWLLCDHEA
ncbi:hypothetical protein VE00_11191 [Pseudogymnoascus sp. WSF 3629]|nr:hypothetical protein VE00_11191 [Pseudogymnoascus sp. WSF 3629]